MLAAPDWPRRRLDYSVEVRRGFAARAWQLAGASAIKYLLENDESTLTGSRRGPCRRPSGVTVWQGWLRAGSVMDLSRLIRS